jgi:hypothetical protein
MIDHYASDVIFAAMRMAQQQAYNSFTFRDVMHMLNQHWRHCYQRIAQIDTGFYSKTVEITKELTHMPRYVMGTVNIYRAPDIVGYNRQYYSPAGAKDLMSRGTYFLDGNDLFCRDAGEYFAGYEKIWLNYVPQAPVLYFTAFNRTPEIIDWDLRPTTRQRTIYGMYSYGISDTGDFTDSEYSYIRPRHILTHRGNTGLRFDITEGIYRGPVGEMTGSVMVPPPTINELYDIVYLDFEFPYAFITYQHRSTGEYWSYLLKNLLGSIQFHKYNPFDYTGRHSNVRFIETSYNDDTGMGVVIEDWDDMEELSDGDIVPKIKKLGFTPDTRMTYPQDCVFDYIVANIAKRFANRNETDIMDIDYAILMAEKEMSLFLKKEKNPWIRVQNVTGPRISDIIW